MATRRWQSAILALLLTLVPAFSMAAGGEANIVLEFSQSDKMFLYISVLLGVIALVVGFIIRGQVLSKSPGNEKMQEVGGAIHEGAIAYLKRQIATMIWFVLLISGLLVVLYMNSYGTMTAVFTALSFVAGVAASYIAGYVGMDMAVRGNMRTAHAAL
ncbi:MAG: hypothetical protein HKUEN07_07260 [Rhodocyclaceae bacterium]|nr:MAG: hypothetical protein HKUEN07_07260 [Rhodocyclaceae bacterium]